MTPFSNPTLSFLPFFIISYFSLFKNAPSSLSGPPEVPPPSLSLCLGRFLCYFWRHIVLNSVHFSTSSDAYFLCGQAGLWKQCRVWTAAAELHKQGRAPMAIFKACFQRCRAGPLALYSSTLAAFSKAYFTEVVVMVSSRAWLPQRVPANDSPSEKRRVGRLNCRKHSDPLNELVSISDPYEWVTNCFYGNKNSDGLLIMPEPSTLHQHLALFITAEGKWHCRNFPPRPVMESASLIIQWAQFIWQNPALSVILLCLCADADACVCVCRYVKRSIFLSFLSWLVFAIWSLHDLEVVDRLCWLPGSLRHSSPSFPRVGVPGVCPQAWHFTWVLGIELRLSCLPDKHFPHWAVMHVLCMFQTLTLLPFLNVSHTVYWGPFFFFRLQRLLGGRQGCISGDGMNVHHLWWGTSFPALLWGFFPKK